MAEGGQKMDTPYQSMEDTDTAESSLEDRESTPQIASSVSTPNTLVGQLKDGGARPKKITTFSQGEHLVRVQEQLRQSMERLAQSMEQLAHRDSTQEQHEVRREVEMVETSDEPRVQGRDPRPSTRNRRSRKFIEPAKFSGENVVWEEYLVKFELIAEWNQWDEEEACEFLLLSLDGDAAIHIHGMCNFRDLDYQGLCDALSDRFGAIKSLAEDKRKFRLRKKQKDETYAHMAQDILRLARRIYKRDFKLAEQEAREQFLKGLPRQVRMAVAAANPRTLNECVDNVAQIQIILDNEELEDGTMKVVRSRAVKTGDPNSITSDENNDPNERMQSDNMSNSGRGRGQGRGRGRGRGRGNYNNYNRFDLSQIECRNCGQKGHMKRNCPHPWGYKFNKQGETSESKNQGNTGSNGKDVTENAPGSGV